MAKTPDFTGDILHFGAVRMRITGSGTLKSYLESLSGINNYNLPDLAMTSATNREPVLLANMNEQRALYGVTTLNFGETFNISKIIVYIKPVATGYPQP